LPRGPPPRRIGSGNTQTRKNRNSNNITKK